MGSRRIASGSLEEVALAAKAVVDQGQSSPVLVFDDATSEVIDLDLRGTPETVRRHAAELDATIRALHRLPRPFGGLPGRFPPGASRP